MADDLTAAQMVGMRLCTSQCLTSTGTEVEHCGCPCKGRWHGLLAKAVIAGSAEARPAPPEPHEGQEDALAHMDLTKQERTALGLESTADAA